MARELKATVREKKGRHAADRLRREGQVPAVIYREGKPGTNLALPENEWKKLLASGQRVVTLKMDGGDKQALIKAVQYDPLGEYTLHVDFNELKEGQKVRVAVSISTKGIPKGQLKGGLVNQPLHTLHVECLPTQIPDKIVIDVENLDLDDVIHVKEVKLPDGVHAIDNGDLVVVAVHEPRTEEAAPAEGGPTEPEVLTAKKEEEPAEGAAGAGKPAEKKDEKKDEKKK
jgi:large subunit ribosomal protein L25